MKTIYSYSDSDSDVLVKYVDLIYRPTHQIGSDWIKSRLIDPIDPLADYGHTHVTKHHRSPQPIFIAACKLSEMKIFRLADTFSYF